MDALMSALSGGWDVLTAVPGLLPALAGALLMLVLVWLWGMFRKPEVEQGRKGGGQALDASYRFAAMSPITADQVDLLQYLQQAFPDGAVLFRPRLGSFLSVRAGTNRIEARDRLDELRVDFLLCGEDGKPLYAFEIDMLRSREDPAQQQILVEKNRILRSAGIRMVRFKGSVGTWPNPDKLRERVLAVGAPQANSGFGASGYAASGFTPTGFNESRLDVSGRVQHGADPSNPWADTNKRS